MDVDPETRAELAARWAYRAGLEHAASLRFARLADRLAAAGFSPALAAIARDAAAQERHHLALCTGLAARFGAAGLPLDVAGPVPEIAPRAWSPRERTVYEVVAFCCVTETANAAVVVAGAADVADDACRRAVRAILADEVQHSRLGWRLLAAHPLDDALARGLAAHLPQMLRGAVRDDLFRPAPSGAPGEPGDPATLRRHGTLPLAERRASFLSAMRDVALPGLSAAGVDPSRGLEYLEGLEARLVTPRSIPVDAPRVMDGAPHACVP